MTEYFLHVDLIVPQRNQQAFEATVTEFLERGGFDRIDPESGKSLVFALRAVPEIEPFREDILQSRPALQDFFHYVHVWRTPSLDDLDLARVMTRSADDDLYRRLDSLVVREVQNFVLRVPWLSVLDPLSLLPKGNVVRIKRRLSTRELGTYLFSLGALIPTLETQGYSSLGYFQNVTGALNTVTEFWRLDPRIALEPNADLKHKIAPLLRTPTEISRAVFGDSETILSAHDNQGHRIGARVFQSYLPPKLLGLHHVNRAA